MSISIPLDSYQAVMIHGWARPSSILNWRHVLQNPRLDWEYLRSLGISPEELRTIQPDPEAWVKNCNVRLYLLPDMACFPVHPIKHLHADIGEIWQMRWPSNLLETMGVRYSELVDIGLTKEIMARWAFPISRWHALGLRSEDLEDWNCTDCARAFYLNKQQTMAELKRLESQRH